jgi:hypothetical protein
MQEPPYIRVGANSKVVCIRLKNKVNMYDKSISLVSYFHIPFSPELTAAPPPHPPLGKLTVRGGGGGGDRLCSIIFLSTQRPCPTFLSLKNNTRHTLFLFLHYTVYLNITYFSLFLFMRISQQQNILYVSLLTTMSHIPPSFSSMSCIVSLFVTAMFCSLSYIAFSFFSTLYRISLCFFMSHISLSHFPYSITFLTPHCTHASFVSH